jgi:hypothetical protein
MAENRSPVDAQLQQLGEARTLVLKDPGYWPQVLQGTLPIITGPIVEVRRWGADFLAETFSTPLVDARAKQELALACLDTLLRLTNETETGILKSVAQCSASVYPIIFRHMYVSCLLLACRSSGSSSHLHRGSPIVQEETPVAGVLDVLQAKMGWMDC